MASSDDFKAQLKAGNIPEALALALSEAVELKFTTWVPSEEDVEISEAQPGHRLRTRINMIEGEVEHEIGEEFIGNGRYRELKQFHLEQVAQGSQLIENNLKSLQKLFEVLVAVHYPDTTPPMIQPESLEAESQRLPPVENRADAGSVVEPLETAVTDAIASPDTLTAQEVPDAGLVAEPPEATVIETVVSPVTVTTEDIAQEPLPPAELPVSSLTPATEQAPVLEEEIDEEDDDDDWDDSVLELLESLPVAPPPTPEASDSDLRENWEWNDLVEDESESERGALDSPENQVWENLQPEDFDLPPASEQQNLEASNVQVDQDLRDFVEDTSQPDRPESDSLDNQNWESLISREDFEFPPTVEQQNLEGSISPLDEDWGDFMEAEPKSEPGESNEFENQAWETLRREDFESPPTVAEQHLETPSSSMDEDWGDLVESEADTELDKPIPNLESLDLEEDDEWDDWVMEESEPVFEAPVVDMDSLELSEDEDWGDLVEDSDPFATPSLGELGSDLEENEDWDDFTAEDLEPSPSSLERNSHTGTGFDLSGTLEDWNSAGLETNKLDRNESLESNFSTDSALPEELEPSVSDNPFDTLAGQEEDAIAKPKSDRKRVPPPPPPSRSPNQNS